jgi:hypothetical protein
VIKEDTEWLRNFLCPKHGCVVVRRLTSGYLDVWYVNPSPSAPLRKLTGMILRYSSLSLAATSSNTRPTRKLKPKYDLDAPTGHLWQMCFTGERFMPEQLEWSDLATQFVRLLLDTMVELCIHLTKFQVISSPAHPTLKTCSPHFFATTRYWWRKMC